MTGLYEDYKKKEIFSERSKRLDCPLLKILYSIKGLDINGKSIKSKAGVVIQMVSNFLMRKRF